MRKDSQSPGIPWVQWIVSVRVNLWHVRWIFNLHAPATIRSLTPSVSGSKFLVVVLYCATDHTTLFYLYLIIYSCHHLLSALSHSAQLEKQSPAACWVFGISARCLKWTFLPGTPCDTTRCLKAKRGSPSPCTVVMRCPSRKRSTLERYEEGPLSTTTSFRTWGRTHRKTEQKHTLVITCKSLSVWNLRCCDPDLTTPWAWLGVGRAEVLTDNDNDNRKQKYHHFFFQHNRLYLKRA